MQALRQQICQSGKCSAMQCNRRRNADISEYESIRKWKGQPAKHMSNCLRAVERCSNGCALAARCAYLDLVMERARVMAVALVMAMVTMKMRVKAMVTASFHYMHTPPACRYQM